jgi:hypothetical protein
MLHHPCRLSSFCCEPHRSWTGLWQQERLQLSRPADSEEKQIQHSEDRPQDSNRNKTPRRCVEWAVTFKLAMNLKSASESI